MNMKTPASAFSFRKNDGVQALPEAVPPVAPASVSERGGKRGRPRDDDAATRERQVTAYLTAEEYEKLSARLDGRPASTVIRRLVLDYINHG
jgi:hypothetical protein